MHGCNGNGNGTETPKADLLAASLLERKALQSLANDLAVKRFLLRRELHRVRRWNRRLRRENEILMDRNQQLNRHLERQYEMPPASPPECDA